MDEYSTYKTTKERNREIFRLNFDADASEFQSMISALRSAWARLGTTRGTSGHSQVGLLLFSNILTRHTIFGFEQLEGYQSYLAWSTFRPGLEALLIIGKLVDNPANAEVWKNRETDVSAYRKAFSGSALDSRSVPRSTEFRQVLNRLNDEFMHPNPWYAYRDATRRDDTNGAVIEIQYFDVAPQVHEGHLLAYLNLLDLIIGASAGLVNNLCGTSGCTAAQKAYCDREKTRALKIAASDSKAKKVMEELGLWSL